MTMSKGDKVVIDIADDDLLIDPVWPGACPASGGISANNSSIGGGGGEQHILTIVCGNQRLSWALHSQQQYYPTLFWQTTPILTTEYPKRSLYELIPPHVRTIIYGPKIKIQTNTTATRDTPVPTVQQSEQPETMESTLTSGNEDKKSSVQEKGTDEIDTLKTKVDAAAAPGVDEKAVSKTANETDTVIANEGTVVVDDNEKKTDTTLDAMDVDMPTQAINEVVDKQTSSLDKDETNTMEKDETNNELNDETTQIITQTSVERQDEVTLKEEDESGKNTTVGTVSATQDKNDLVDGKDSQPNERLRDNLVPLEGNATTIQEHDSKVASVRKIGRPRKPENRMSSKPSVDIADDSLLADSRFYTAKRAVRYRSTFRIPAISIYIVSTNDVHAKGIASLFRNIPCRIFHLSSDDFDIPSTVQLTNSSSSSSKTQQSMPGGESDSTDYTNMNVDRICLLEGARYLYAPQKAFLIFDTGNTSTMTYTATDHTGRLLGGGISPSISMKFRAYNDYSSWTLPHIWRTTVLEHVRKSKGINQSKQNDTDSSNSSCSPITIEDAVIRSVLKETALSVSNVIKGWMDCVQSTATSSKNRDPLSDLHPSSTEAPEPPMLLVAGTDAEILRLLLQSKHSNLCDSSDNSDAIAQFIEKAVSSEQLKVSYSTKNSPTLLAHHGIQYMLLQQEQVKKALTRSTTAASIVEDVRDTLLGQRVAHIPGASDKLIGSIVTDIAEVPTRAKFIYGSVIHIFRNSKKDDHEPSNNKSTSIPGLENDYYSIFWDESCTIDDVTPAELYDFLVLYSKANEVEEETDPGRKKRLAEKMEEAKTASVLLAQNSLQVRHALQDRLPPSSPFPLKLLPKKTPPPTNKLTSVPGTTKSAKKMLVSTVDEKSQGKKHVSIKSDKLKVSSIGRPAKYTSAKSIPPLKSSAKKYTSSKSIPPPSVKRKKEEEHEKDIISPNRRKRSRGSYNVDLTPSPPTVSSKKSKKVGHASNMSLYKKQAGASRDEADPYINRRIAKEFDGDVYFGFVKFFTPAIENDEGSDLWGIEYDDGDAEDFEEDELMNGFLLYRKHVSKDAVGNAAKRAKMKSSHV